MSEILFTEVKGQNFTSKNRFFKSAMSETMGDNNHAPTKELITLYQRWADGGAGILVTGNVMVDHTALGEPGNIVIEDERDLALLSAWAKAGTKNDTLLFVQLNHPGRQSPNTVTKSPVAPSAIPLKEELKPFFNEPRELKSEEIWDIVKRFGNAARISKKAGFSGVQIHGAHGYLVSQFLSPHTNRRTDEWGGDLNGRMKFLVEIYQEIRRQVGEDFPVALKLNSADFQRGGFTEEESMKVLEKMDELGIDLLEISGGNYENQAMFEGARESTRKREAYFMEYAKKAREKLSAILVVTGGFKTEEGMSEAIESGDIDMVGVAKLFGVKPDFPNQMHDGTYHVTEIKPIKTGIKKIDDVAGSMIELFWYEEQMKRMGRKLDPKVNLHPWYVFMKILIANGTSAFKKRRM